MTATQTATPSKISYINHSIERKLGRAETARQEAIAKISSTGATLSFDIEKLIKAEAELRVWSEIDRFITAHSEIDKSEDETLARLTEYLSRYAIAEHKINSTSNIHVEQETELRCEFARAYNFIADTARASL
jgi:hypothetical protein